jgi:hypothetical protein
VHREAYNESHSHHGLARTKYETRLLDVLPQRGDDEAVDSVDSNARSERGFNLRLIRELDPDLCLFQQCQSTEASDAISSR